MESSSAKQISESYQRYEFHECHDKLGIKGADYKKLRRGWCFGGDGFREQLLGQMTERMGAEHYGQERWERVEAHAEGIVEAELTYKARSRQ